MNELLRFSLKRRLLNRNSLILQFILIVLVVLILYSDLIIGFFSPQSIRPLGICNQGLDSGVLSTFIPTEFALNPETCDFTITIDSFGYHVESVQPISTVQSEAFKEILTRYHMVASLNAYPPEIQMQLEGILYPPVSFTQLEAQKSNKNILFVVITGIYFMTLSFSTLVANEIVHEKTSNFLELICSSVRAREHFYAKLCTGWLTILAQCSIFAIIALTAVYSRWLFDQGSALLLFLNRIKILPMAASSFGELLKVFDLGGKSLLLFAVSFLFLVLGILTIQTVLALISARVRTIEEAGSIQGPFYILFLLIYYLTLFSFNSDAKMIPFLIRTLSLTPVFSMLFMPGRLLLAHVNVLDVLCGLISAAGCFSALVIFCSKRYQNVVLERRGSTRSM